MSGLERDLGLLLWSKLLDRDLSRQAHAFSGKDELWGARAVELSAGLSLDTEKTRFLVEARASLDAGAFTVSLAGRGMWFVESDAPDYPHAFRASGAAPFGLFGCGERAALSAVGETKTVGIVGTRRASAGAAAFSRRLGEELAAAGVRIASGLSPGVSEEAHLGAVAHRGMTLAVVGCGVDLVHPRRLERGVRRDILATGGAIVSEYWPETTPAPWRFPPRFRILAGLIDALVVIESGPRSSALIASDFAIELGRPVLAVPHSPWDRSGDGGNALLRMGAAVVCDRAQDVMDVLQGDRDNRSAA